MSFKKAILSGFVFLAFPIIHNAAQNYPMPDARGRGYLIYHPASKEMLLFDGYVNHADSTENDVWKWNGSKWQEVVAFGPGSRILNAVALNNKTGEVNFFAGWGRGTIDDKKNDLWAFNDESWKKLNADTIGTRDHHKMIYADHLGAFVVYGGFDFNFKPDTLTWLLRDNHFISVPVKGPGARGNFGFAYDKMRKKVVLFGGNFLKRDRPADLWEFDGKKWEEVKVPDIGITSTHSMIYADDLKMSIVQNEKGETWGWDGKTMKKIATNGPTEFGVALGYDRDRKTILAYGGFGPYRTTVAALWELKNGSWKKIADNGIWKQQSRDSYIKLDPSVDITIPEERWAHQMTYDESSNRVLLFGGSHGNKILGDLWAWNGLVWQELTISGAPPTNKGIFVYDTGRKKSVLFGGANSDDQNVGTTWEWNGQEWNEIKINGPEARVHGLGAYDYKNKVVMIFGGFGLSGALKDTWTYDGKTWKLLNADGPQNCMPHGMIYDEDRKTVVMITVMLSPDSTTGKPRNEMWEWIGMSWEKLKVAVPAIMGLQTFASFDENEIIAFDGNDVPGSRGATWKYRSGNWQIATNAGPGIRAGHVMVYDRKRKKIVLFGGGKADTNIRYNDTWEWDGKMWRKVK